MEIIEFYDLIELRLCTLYTLNARAHVLVIISLSL